MSPPAEPLTRYGRSRHLVLATAGRLLLTMFTMMVISFGAAVLGFQIVTWAGGSETMGTIGAHVTAFLFSIPLVWSLRRWVEGDRSGYLAMGWRGSRTLVHTLIGLGAAAVCIVAGLLASVALGHGRLRLAELSASEFAVSLVLVFTVSVLLQGFPEELLWRGYLQTTLMERLGPWRAALLGALGFGAMHVVSIGSGDTVASKVLYVVGAICMGAAMGALRLVTGSTWAAIGFHSGYHIVNRTRSVWVEVSSGDGFAVVTPIACAVVALACWLVWRLMPGRVAAGHSGSTVAP